MRRLQMGRPSAIVMAVLSGTSTAAQMGRPLAIVMAVLLGTWMAAQMGLLSVLVMAVLLDPESDAALDALSGRKWDRLMAQKKAAQRVETALQMVRRSSSPLGAGPDLWSSPRQVSEQESPSLGTLLAWHSASSPRHGSPVSPSRSSCS